MTVTGDVSMKNYKITDLKTPTTNKDAANKKYVDDRVVSHGGLTQNKADTLYFSKAGGVVSGEKSMSRQKIIDLGYPTGNNDAATKQYVDTSPVKVTGNVDMKGHRLTGLPTPPTSDSDVATKKWVTDEFPTKSEVLNGFTMLGPLDMGGHKLYELRAPTNDKDAANKKYVDDNALSQNTADQTYLSKAGGVVSGEIDMSNQKIIEVGWPTGNKNAATKKYVDDNSAVFKDGSTTTNQLDLRRVLGSIGIFEDVTFHSGAYSQDVTATSPSSAVVNIDSLQNGGLVGLNSLVPTLKSLLHTLQEQKFDADFSLLVLKGTVASHTVEHKDASLVNNVSLSKVGNETHLTINFKKDLAHGVYSYEFEISSDHTSGFDLYMFGECGGTGYNGKSLYRFWSSADLSGKDYSWRKEDVYNGGYFLRGSGKKVQMVGSFRYSGDTIVNRGKPYSLNTDTVTTFTGRTYEFMVQKLTLDSSATSSSILGSSLKFVIEPDGNGTLDLKADSYFSITKNVSLTV